MRKQRRKAHSNPNIVSNLFEIDEDHEEEVQAVTYGKTHQTLLQKSITIHNELQLTVEFIPIRLAELHHLFQQKCSKILDKFILGEQVNLILFGAIGQGHTVSSTGNPTHNGVMHHCIRSILSKLEEVPARAQFQLSLSYFGIYPQQIVDLLSKIQSPSYKSILCQRPIKSLADASYCLNKASQIRKSIQNGIYNVEQKYAAQVILQLVTNVYIQKALDDKGRVRNVMNLVDIITPNHDGSSEEENQSDSIYLSFLVTLQSRLIKLARTKQPTKLPLLRFRSWTYAIYENRINQSIFKYFKDQTMKVAQKSQLQGLVEPPKLLFSPLQLPNRVISKQWKQYKQHFYTTLRQIELSPSSAFSAIHHFQHLLIKLLFQHEEWLKAQIL